MAEAVGLAASVIGIIGLAGKISQGCQVAAQFWDDFRDSPKSVRQLQEELELLRQVAMDLNVLGSDIQQSFVASATLACALKQCFEAMEPISKLIAKHLAKIKGGREHKWWDQAKLAWRQDRVAKCVVQIERAKLQLQGVQLNIILSLQRNSSSETQKIQDCLEMLNSRNFVQLSRLQEIVEGSKAILVKSSEVTTKTRHSVEQNTKAITSNTNLIAEQLDDLPARLSDRVERTVRDVLQSWSQDFRGIPQPKVSQSLVLATAFHVPPNPISSPGATNTGRSAIRSMREKMQGIIKVKNMSSRCYKTWFGSVIMQTISTIPQTSCPEIHASDQTTESKYHAVNLLPHRFISNRGLFIQISPGTFPRGSSFDMQLRLYNIIPDDAPVFQACIGFDVASLRNLFRSGQASPFDRRATYSESLLDVIFDTTLHRIREYGAYPSQKLVQRQKEILDFLVTDCGLDPGEIGTSASYPNVANSLVRLDWACKDLMTSSASPSVTLALQMASTILTKSRNDPIGPGNPCLKFMQDGPAHQSGHINAMIERQEEWSIDWDDFTDVKNPNICVETHHQIVSDPEAKSVVRVLREMGLVYEAHLSTRVRRVPPFHSILALAAYANRCPSVRREWESSIKRAYQARIVALLQLGVDEQQCWRADSQVGFYREKGIGLENPTQFAQRVGMADLWRDSLIKCGMHTAMAIENILDEHIYTGMSDMFDEGCIWKTRQEQVEEFERRLSEGYFCNNSEEEISRELEYLEVSLGMVREGLYERVQMSKLAFMMKSVPGSWPDLQ